MAGVQDGGGQHTGQEDDQVHHHAADTQPGQAEELALSWLASVIPRGDLRFLFE